MRGASLPRAETAACPGTPDRDGRRNSLLIQQTSRRSEELHVLNEIGRALSSTLHKEDLLRKIWEELRRLFDVENFYIASLDTVRDEMHFDLEIIDGARIPRVPVQREFPD